MSADVRHQPQSRAGTTSTPARAGSPTALAARAGRKLAVDHHAPTTSSSSTACSSAAIAVAWMPPLMHARAARSEARRSPRVRAQRRAHLPRGAARARRFASHHRARACVARARPGPIRTRRRAICSRSCICWPPASTRATTSSGALSRHRRRRLPRRRRRRRRRLRATTSATPPAPRATITQARAPRIAPVARRRVGAQLRILDVTDPIPPDGMVLAPPLDGRLQAPLRDALLSLHEDARRRARAARPGAGRSPDAGHRATSSRLIARLRAHVPQR